MRRLLPLLMVAVSLITMYQPPASAGIKYLDRAPIVAVVKHRVLTEKVVARRERILRERRERLRRERVQAQAAATAVSSTATDTSTTYGSYPSGNAGCLSAAQVASYARAAGFPEYTISTMVYYASRESGYCPGAINSSSGACGLWQMYPCPGPDALDPARNASLAYSKYTSSIAAGASGFAPWGG